MRAGLFVALLAVSLAWMLWAQARMQHRVLSFLVGRAGGSSSRGARVTHLVQAAAALIAVLVLAAAVLVELRWNAVYLRMPLAASVLLVYVPFAATLGRTKLRKVRKTVEQRMNELGAPPDVTTAIAWAGRPWSLFGSLVMLAAVLILTWHHLRN